MHAQEFPAELRDCVDQENQVVDEDVVLGGPCAEPGSHCVEEPNQCVFIGLDDDKQYRKVVDRVKRSVCEEGSDPSEECKSCPEGASRVCARGEWYSGKDIVEGTCEDFYGTFIVLGGKCIPGGN